jgi:hypothetical protein
MDSLDKFKMLGRFIEPWKYGVYPMDKVLVPGSFFSSSFDTYRKYTFELDALESSLSRYSL